MPKKEIGVFSHQCQNTFNKINCVSIVWHKQHHWPSGAQFVFNCYKHDSSLLICHSNGSKFFVIYSKKCATQGDPRFMIVYDFGVLTLIENFNAEFPLPYQLWYAEDAAASSKFEEIKQLLTYLEVHGPGYRYFPSQERVLFLLTQTNWITLKDSFIVSLAWTS